MGYFPNGASTRLYQDRYCQKCRHDINGNCAVWLAHLVTDYCDKDGETSEAGKVLDLLIPNTDTGCGPCKMFAGVYQ